MANKIQIKYTVSIKNKKLKLKELPDPRTLDIIGFAHNQFPVLAELHTIVPSPKQKNNIHTELVYFNHQTLELTISPIALLQPLTKHHKLKIPLHWSPKFALSKLGTWWQTSNTQYAQLRRLADPQTLEPKLYLKKQVCHNVIFKTNPNKWIQCPVPPEETGYGLTSTSS